MNLPDIGERLRSLREESKLTQKTIAEYLSCDQSFISKLENGERMITSDIIERLSILFCCPIDYILYGEDMGKECVVSFRRKDITPEDLKSLAMINKIALNQFEMDKILGDILDD